MRADGRIHATFNQTVARTGRLSSDAPNLHNIPVRTEQGRTLPARRSCPAPGCELLVADYNQIELRCIAHLAEDPGLIAAFDAGEDIHTATAARVFQVEPDDVTPAQRAKAKMVVLRARLRHGVLRARPAAQHPGATEAAEILDAYFVAFPSVKAYMERTVARGARARLHRDAVRPAPSDPGAVGVATAASARPASARR